MAGRWVVDRVENGVSNGMPDIFYTMPGGHGLVELKYLPSLPKRSKTPVKPGFRPVQPIWIERHGIGGHIFLLVRVDTLSDREYFLFNWRQSLECGNWDIAEWRKSSLGYWEKSIDFDKLYCLLSFTNNTSSGV
jgi:hypothetical protein